MVSRFSQQFGRNRVSQPRIRPRRGVSMADIVPSPDEREARPVLRLAVIGVIALALLGVMVLRLFSLQVVNAKSFSAAVTANGIRVEPLAAPRGTITDRSATVLVGNQVGQEIVLSRVEANQNPEVIGQVAALVGKSPAQVKAILNDPKYDPYQPAPILTNAPSSTVQYLEEHQAEFPGVSVQSTSTRAYPQGGTVAPQVLGYVGAISAAELKANPKGGYTQASTYGQSGVENYYQEYLRGIDGYQAIEVNARGEVQGIVKVKAPVSGDTLVTNLDLGLQQNLETNLANQIAVDRKTPDPRSGVIPPAPNGAAMVMDPNNGQILAMASFPNYDLNSWVGGISQSQLAPILSSGALNNYAIDGLYTPGSTFKMITATAALQSGLLTGSYSVDDTGKFTVPGCTGGAGSGCSFKDDENGGLGEVNMPLAITESSDYYFYNIGYLFDVQQSKYGTEPIQKMAAQYGIGEPSGVDLPGEALGRVDSQAVRIKLHAQAPKAFPHTTWYTGDNIEMAFGQGATVVTPLEMAVAYSTFLNGGTRYAPQIANAIVSPSGKLIKQFEPVVTGHVALNPNITTPIFQGLEGVVQSSSPAGTAFATFQQYAHFSESTFPVGGKTGTASNAPGLEPNSWFIGFGPGQHPQYVIVCVIDQGGYGANAAAPVVANTFNYLVNNPVGPVTLPTASSPPVTTPPATKPPAGANLPTTTTTTTPAG